MIGIRDFERELGIEAQRLRQRGLRFLHFALERICGGQISIDLEYALALVDRLLAFVDRGVQMPEAEFSFAQEKTPRTLIRIVRTQLKRPLLIGFGLREATERLVGPTLLSA